MIGQLLIQLLETRLKFALTESTFAHPECQAFPQ
jgi:hypothetical protein